MLFLRDYGDTEVGGFGIAPNDDLLLIEDVQLVKQTCSWAHVAFDDESVADFFDQQVDAGRRPEQFARTWIHTHPDDCARPSMTDEQTFARVFGSTDWSVMFILARGGQSYARLRFNVGPCADLEIPVSVDYSRPFAGCDFGAWQEEYLANVQPEIAVCKTRSVSQLSAAREADLEAGDDWQDAWFEYADPEQKEGGFLE